jgi:hypothetical protein
MRYPFPLMAAVVIPLFAGCAPEKAPEVSFANDVKPILDESCLSCHTQDGEGYQKSGFSMESYQAFMRGTKHGPVIRPGDAASSTLVRLVEGKADPSIRMPFHKEQLPEEKIAVIRDWVDQGAKDN